MCSSGHDEEVAFEEEWLEGSSAEHGGAMSEVAEAASARTKGVPCLTLCTVYKEEPCCAAVAVRAEGCAINAAVDRVATGIEDEVAVVVIGGHSAIVESVAITVATRVMHEPAAIVVVAGAAAVVCEGAATKAAGVHAANGIVLGTNAVVAEWAASRVKGKVAIDAVKAVSHTCRKKTAAAATGVVVAIPY
jgi:hypothetical protein